MPEPILSLDTYACLVHKDVVEFLLWASGRFGMPTVVTMKKTEEEWNKLYKEYLDEH